MKSSINDSFRFLAARYLRKQAKQLATELVGVRNAADVECVHQARIASRRLRAALELFRDCPPKDCPPKDCPPKDCPPKKMTKRWLKAIRRVTNGLGRARDCDVHIEEMSELLLDLQNRTAKSKRLPKRDRATTRAVALLLVDQQRQREACQPHVLQDVDRIEQNGALEEILHMAKETLVDADGLANGGHRADTFAPLVRRLVGKQILDKYERLKSLEGCLEWRGDHVRHHEMRIAAKRLRYAMEIVRPLYAGRLDKSISDVKQLQAILGDIHDCDLWYIHLDEFSHGLRRQVKKAYGNIRPFAELKRGFDYLRRLCKIRRGKRFDDLLEFWAKLERKGRWEKLLKTVRNESSRQIKRAEDGGQRAEDRGQRTALSIENVGIRL